MERMQLIVDDGMQPLDEPFITLTFKDGLRATHMVPRATGSAERPMPRPDIAEKFTELATMSLSVEQANRLWSTLTKLEELDDCRKIENLLAGDADNRSVFF
jgi:ABC-type uncharacterized transport system ATPase subunit